MSVEYVCDRCGARSTEPFLRNWVHHLVSKDFTRPVDSQKLAHDLDLCHRCREAFEDWMNPPQAAKG